jgi:hypothetical protein
VIDYRNEKIMTLRELAEALGMGYTTVRKYVVGGFVGVNGERVFLETVVTPQGRCTSKEAYYRFLDKINGK